MINTTKRVVAEAATTAVEKAAETAAAAVGLEAEVVDAMAVMAAVAVEEPPANVTRSVTARAIKGRYAME